MGEGLETSLPSRDALEEGKPDIQGQNSPSGSEAQSRGFWKPVDRTGEGTPSGPPSDSPRELEDSAGPLCPLQSLGCWRAAPVAFSSSVRGRKRPPPSALHEPLGEGVCVGSYVAGTFRALRGAQLTCLSVPSGPAPSKDGSGLGMAGRG